MFDDILGAPPRKNPCKNADLPIEQTIVEECDGNCDCGGNCKTHDPTGISDEACEDCGNTFDDCTCDGPDLEEDDVWDASDSGCDGCSGC